MFSRRVSLFFLLTCRVNRTIQWFPGHMTRARKLIVAALRFTDVVLEICDARAPLSSRNPLLGELLGEKPRVLLLNKADLAGKACVQAWKQKLALERWPVLGISCSKRQGLDPIRVLAKKLSSGQKWFGSRAVRVLVAGIPNVGSRASFLFRHQISRPT